MPGGGGGGGMKIISQTLCSSFVVISENCPPPPPFSLSTDSLSLLFVMLLLFIFTANGKVLKEAEIPRDVGGRGGGGGGGGSIIRSHEDGGRTREGHFNVSSCNLGLGGWGGGGIQCDKPQRNRHGGGRGSVTWSGDPAPCFIGRQTGLTLNLLNNTVNVALLIKPPVFADKKTHLTDI